MRTVSAVDMLSRMTSSSRRASPVVVAMEPDRGLPDAFDQVEHVGSLLIAHGIAENPPEQPDFLAQPRIRFKRGDLVAAIAAQVGFGRHDLGRHGLLQKLPGTPQVASFSLRRKIKMEAERSQTPRRPREGGDP